MLWGSNQSKTVKYIVAKESGVVISADYMGKMGVCFEDSCSSMIQNRMI